MRKKKSYMNKNNILSEGVLDTIIKYLTQYPKLKNLKHRILCRNNLNGKKFKKRNRRTKKFK